MFLNSTTCSEKCNRVKGSIAQIARFDARYEAETSLIERERRAGHRPNIYLDRYASVVKVVIEQLAILNGWFGKVCQLGELYVIAAQVNQECVVERKRALPEHERYANRIIPITSD